MEQSERRLEEDFGYEQAVMVYLNSIDGTRWLKDQPSRALSTLSRCGQVWTLRNQRGVVARVSKHGHLLPVVGQSDDKA